MNDDLAHRGGEIYERSVRPRISAADEGKFVAIDVASGAWEMDSDDFTSTERLLTRVPDAQIWLVRVGHRATYRIGGLRMRAVEAAA